ncbi:MAG TPA: hypothetical protein VHR45_24555 [Thermoanaerobaculia bacterium]|nr:hypothetical protein [Thermoanaerobaculia bacterium]
MRKTFMFALVLSLVAAFAYAQTAAPAAAPPAGGATTTTTTAPGATSTTTTKATGGKTGAKKPSKKNHSSTGTVGAVNQTDKSFTLTGPPPAGTVVVAINTNDKTTYAKGQSWADVVDGANATASYKVGEDGKNWAVKITVKKPKAPKKPKTTG